VQLSRHERKDQLCRRALFPLVRAVDHSLTRVGLRPLIEWLVEWLVELWFIYHDVVDRERREAHHRRLGEVPDDWTAESLTDARVTWMMEFSDETRMDYAALFKSPTGDQPAPQDPFAAARTRIELFTLERLTHPEGRWTLPERGCGWARGKVLVPVPDGVLVGEGECFDAGYLFIPDGLLSTRIALDLATQQAAEMLDLYERARIRAVTTEQALRGAESMHEGLINWVHATPDQRAEALAKLAVRFGRPRPDDDELRRLVTSSRSATARRTIVCRQSRTTLAHASGSSLPRQARRPINCDHRGRPLRSTPRTHGHEGPNTIRRRVSGVVPAPTSPAVMAPCVCSTPGRPVAGSSPRTAPPFRAKRHSGGVPWSAWVAVPIRRVTTPVGILSS
jgi:hypothetical protein